VAAFLVFVVAMTTACSTRVGGKPIAGGSASSASTAPDELPASTSEGLLGDLTTVDPCGYIEPELFDEFGSPEWGVSESLDYCTIEVSTDDGEVLITVGHLDDQFVEENLESQRVSEVDDELWIGQPADAEDYCSLMLVFTDEITLRVDGTAIEGTPTSTCDMVDAGMAGVVEAIKADRVGHREPEEDSLQKTDPCDLLSDASVAAQPGMADSTRYDYPAKHECIWVTHGVPTVRLLFSAGPEPTPYGEGSTASDIGGRPSVTYPVPDGEESSYCIVDSEHVPFTSPGQEDLVEIASVWVDMEIGQVDAACAAATALASEVWPKLPGV
jgi:hypothetical protein